MLLYSNIILLLGNAIALRRIYSILFNRVTIMILLTTGLMGCESLFVSCLDTGIGVYNGLFHSTAITHSFDLFVYIIGAIILLLTAYYPRRLIETSNSIEGIYVRSVHKIGGNVINTLFSKDYVKAYKNAIIGIDAPQFTILEYPLIILFILIGGILLMSSSDVVTMFLVIELQSYGLYILCTLYCDSEWSTSAGLTYFLLGGLSSCFILLGSAFLYTDCGLTNFDCLFIFNDLTTILFDVELITAYNFYVENPEILNMGFLIMSVGYLFKISAAPFHFWSPDVYDGIPVHVTTFVAVVPKIFLIMFLSGLVFNPGSLLSFKFNWTGVLLISSFLSLIIGTVVGLVQFRFKRLLAYSAITHVGFLLLAISIKSLESFQALIFYIAQYSLSSINIFFIAIVVGYHLLLNTRYPSDMPEKQNSPLQLISQLKGFYHLNPLLAVALAISFFSLMGIPPLIGFFGKQMILSAALQGGYIFMSIIGILTSVIGAVYYLLVIKCIFFDKNEDVIDSKIHVICPSRINSAFTVTISALTLMILLFILYPSIWLSSANILALIIHSP